jgi:hypothetical protein
VVLAGAAASCFFAAQPIPTSAAITALTTNHFDPVVVAIAFSLE